MVKVNELLELMKKLLEHSDECIVNINTKW